ncbi:MAG: hypothetical protein COA84_12985 [Robiginitomaculum sp.]|nr:MAG: hypothetical protein COA84_12985 [Robiginitomaculum sp.]
MILLDLSQVMIATLMISLGKHTNAEVDESMLRHMIINSLRMNHHKFSREYGPLIICADDTNYWRKDIFPYYKAGRKDARKESEIDWNVVFKSLNRIKAEIKEFLPYKVIQSDRAEADDVIGTIARNEGTLLNSEDKILILSGDKDYIQLQKFANVSQYDPTRKKFITHNDPAAYLHEHILRGDRGDGIPNVLSADNSFVDGIRQKQLRATKIAKWDSGEVPIDQETQRNIARNRALIDLSEVPGSIKVDILRQWDEPNTKTRAQLVSYFMKYKLKHLMEHIGEF